MRFIHRQSFSIPLSHWPLVVQSAVAAVFVILAVGCNRTSSAKPDKEEAKAAPSKPQVVKLVHPKKKDVRRLIKRPGFNIEADERTPLYAKIPGYVRKWYFDMGAKVNKDEVLADLYIPEMEIELKQKIAAVRQASFEIKQAEAAVLRAQAEMGRAKSQYDRLANLGRKGVIDKEQVDESRLGFEAAQAAAAKAQADVDVAKARLEVAQAAQDHVQTLLQYTKVRAPYDGIVTQRKVNTRDFVQPGAGNKGAYLFVVEKINTVRVFINVQEMDAVWIRNGDVGLIRVQSLQGRGFRGTVARTARSLNPQNRTLRTEIDLPNPRGELLPGTYVTATIIAEHKNVWTLPAAAVVTKGEENFCYLVKKGKAVRTPVQIGMTGGDLVELRKIRTGAVRQGEKGKWEAITGKEAIIASDAAGLSDGQAVRPRR
jgi:RND family efflux transporter MFP subunit